MLRPLPRRDGELPIRHPQARPGDVSGALQRLLLVLHDGLGVAEQPADEPGLAVVHGTAGVEAEEFDGMSRAGRGVKL